MDIKKQGICQTCHYSRTCSIKTVVTSSWECSEYESSRIFLDAGVIQPAYSMSTMHSADLKGLCNSCESSASCQWVQPDAVIFHCEHYQ